MSDSESESVHSESSSKRKRSDASDKEKITLSNVRRIASENFLVTITKLDAHEGEVLKKKANEILNDKEICWGYVIGQEKHRIPGKVHHHIFMHFEKKV